MTGRQIRADGGFTLVELLVVMVVMAIVATATIAVVVSTSRAQSFTSQLRTVMDEARTSLDRIREEVRMARLIHEDLSSESTVSFWIDHDQDSIVDAEETVCYRTEIVPGEADRWRLIRYLDLDPSGEPCDASDTTTYAGGQIIAQTLRTTVSGSVPPLFGYVPDPPGLDPSDDDNVEILTLEMTFDVKNSTRGPDALEVAATIRLRNVAGRSGT